MATVSVVTPYKDAERFLPAFVEMLQAQTYTDWICLLVDDGSTDYGPTLLSGLAKIDSRLVPLRRPGSKRGEGPAEARNFALLFTNTPYIAFCDIDDLWHPEKLELQVRFHTSNHLQISVTGYGRFHDSIPAVVSSWRCPPASLPYSRLLTANALPMLSVVVNRSLLDKSFPLCRHEDYCYWLDIFRRRPEIRYGCLPYALAFYRVHDGNLTGRRLEMLIWVNDVYREHGIPAIMRILLLLRWGLIQVGFFVRGVLPDMQRAMPLNSLLEMPPVLLR